MNGRQGLPDGTFCCRALVLSFPLCGNSLLNQWIPAFAGMTEGLRSGIRQEWKGGCRDGDKPHSSPVVIPAQAGIHAYRDVGGRAASGTGRRGGRAGVRRDGRVCRMPASGYRARVLSFPRCGNGLSRLLDSALHRNDNGGFRPAPGGYGSPRGLAPSAAAGPNFTSAQAGFPCPAAASGYWIGAARSGAPPSRRGPPQRPGFAVSARNRAG